MTDGYEDRKKVVDTVQTILGTAYADALTKSLDRLDDLERAKSAMGSVAAHKPLGDAFRKARAALSEAEDRPMTLSEVNAMTMAEFREAQGGHDVRLGCTGGRWGLAVRGRKHGMTIDALSSHAEPFEVVIAMTKIECARMTLAELLADAGDA